MLRSSIRAFILEPLKYIMSKKEFFLIFTLLMYNFTICPIHCRVTRHWEKRRTYAIE